MPKPSIAQPPFVMIRTFSARLRARGRSLTGGSASGRKGARSGGPPTAPRFPGRAAGGNHFACVSLGSEAGDTLIEIVVSALIVGLIVVGTFTGFSVINRASADQRHHSQASLLASQSQEQLRSDPASALDTLETSPHSYTQIVEGTTYTIKQEAEPVGSSGTTSGCSVSNATAQTGAYIQIISSVTWPQLGTRKAVKQATLITPPTGSDLEVDVESGATPATGVSGITATAMFTPEESSTATTIEGTTGVAGCVVFTGIPATSALVTIVPKTGYVTPNGELKVTPKEVKIAPNITTHYPVTYNKAGEITAEFTYKGEPTYKGETVRSDTFVAYNVKIPAEPKFEVGAPENNFEYKTSGEEEEYKALTTIVAPSATTAHGTKFPEGNLFPFSEKWQVYAGDCPANSVETVTETTEKISNPTTVVGPGGKPFVKVPLSYVTLNVMKGNALKPGGSSTEPYEVKITDSACASALVPNNASAANLVHIQKTTTSGHLSYPFQPFGKGFKLCLASVKPSPRLINYTTYENTTVKGSEFTIYPEEPTKAEYEVEEGKQKTTWETEEKAKGKPTKTERLAKEAAEKSEREVAEAKRGYTIGSGTSC
jgi:Tfp pilus assembly protein PilV